MMAESVRYAASNPFNLPHRTTAAVQLGNWTIPEVIPPIPRLLMFQFHEFLCSFCLLFVCPLLPWVDTTQIATNHVLGSGRVRQLLRHPPQPGGLPGAAQVASRALPQPRRILQPRTRAQTHRLRSRFGFAQYLSHCLSASLYGRGPKRWLPVDPENQI